MHRINPSKLLLSKWTAVQPLNREKHFLVTELYRNDEGIVLEIELQAILTGRSRRCDWRELRDDAQWHMGWL